MYNENEAKVKTDISQNWGCPMKLWEDNNNIENLI